MRLSEHFNSEEFLCPCCQQQHMNPVFIHMLERARQQARIPFDITSGWRCPARNQKAGGKPNSAHLRGLAADIAATTSRQRYRILRAALLSGFNRIGIGSDFIHLDCDTSLPSEVVWDYAKKDGRSPEAAG